MITQEELLALAQQLKALGVQVQENPEEVKAYFPEVDRLRDFYLPKVPKNFYYDPNVFRRLLGLKELK